VSASPQPNRVAWVGRSLDRREDSALLSGEGRYVADIELPGQLHATFVRSQFAHARIRSIDTSEAASAEGTVAILTPQDIPRLPLPPFLWSGPSAIIEKEIKPEVKHSDQYLLPMDKTRHVGEALVMVVATNRYLAEDAAEMVEVDYEELDAVSSIEDALRPDAPLVHEGWGDNVAARFTVSKGDVAEAFARAAHVVKERFAIQRQVGLPLETRGAVADFRTASRELTLWSSTQNVHPLQKSVATLLGLDLDDVRVVAPDVGGGFGTKGVLYVEDPLVAFAAMRLGRPVKWVEDRIEHMQSAIHAREQEHTIELALSDGGDLLALRDNFFVDNGAFTHIGIAIPYNTIAHLMGPYRIPNLEANATTVMSTRTPTAPYRGAGRPEAVFALERALERAARLIGMDPVEIRRKNLVTPQEMPYDAGIRYRTGEPLVMDGGDFPAMLARATELIGYEGRNAAKRDVRPSIRRGFGFGAYTEGTGVGPFEGAVVRGHRDGTISVHTGACSQGQGHRTVFAQICADALGVDPSIVNVHGGDTRGIRFGWGTIASRSAVVAGNAVGEASLQLRGKIMELASNLLEADAADLTLADGEVRVTGAPKPSISLSELFALAEPGPDHVGPHHGLQAEFYFEPSSVTWAGGVHAAVVDVDIETGTVTPVKYVVVHDCGRPINPRIVEGQIHGGVAQGFGGALLEEVVYGEAGQMLTVTLADYMAPTAEILPPIVVDELDSPSPLNPLGIKGIGEGGAVPPPAVLSNAVEDALSEYGGIISRTPLSPNYVLSLVTPELTTARKEKESVNG
jgi:carbon-monoxide dehydrogenase large subunit